MTPAQIEQLKKRRSKHDLIRIGQMMSNVLFNIKQDKNVPEWLRNKSAEMQEMWDKAKRESQC